MPLSKWARDDQILRIAFPHDDRIPWRPPPTLVPILGRPAVRMRRPSGLNAACHTEPDYFIGGATGWPVSASHTRAVPS